MCAKTKSVLHLALIAGYLAMAAGLMRYYGH